MQYVGKTEGRNVCWLWTQTGKVWYFSTSHHPMATPWARAHAVAVGWSYRQICLLYWLWRFFLEPLAGVQPFDIVPHGQSESKQSLRSHNWVLQIMYRLCYNTYLILEDVQFEIIGTIPYEKCHFNPVKGAKDTKEGKNSTMRASDIKGNINEYLHQASGL